MKSYLSLIPIAAKVHRRQNRMTLLCIIFAVFLVTAVFSMADMGIRMEQTRLLSKHGNLSVKDIIGSSMGQTLLLIAAALFVLILIAGVLMISSSMNSTVAQRTKFFGMMRCIGMSQQQIIHYVRLEALYWCIASVPIGVGIGMITTWGLCSALRFLVGEEFSSIPLFGISILGILSGIAVGIITVLLAASSPAKRAAKVSPIVAISGNAEPGKVMRHGMHLKFLKIETILGINHAVSAKKNLLLMTGSLALSIILFFSFTVLLDFVGYLMPQYSNTADFTITSKDGENALSHQLLPTIRDISGVEEVFGRRSLLDLPAEVNRESIASTTIDLISYDAYDLSCLKKDNLLHVGSDLTKVYGDSNYVLATWDPDSLLEIGDKVTIGNTVLEIAGLLPYDPFSSDGLTHGKITLIASDETFVRFTGVTDYSLIMVQTATDITNDNVALLRAAIQDETLFRDVRDQYTGGTYTAFVFCVYSFLLLITMVTLMQMINSIAMSVSGKMKQYGEMRAVGMDLNQIAKMILTEAFVYGLSGMLLGCVVGLLIRKLLYESLIANHFAYAVWLFPYTQLLLIFLFVMVAVAGAAYAPSKRIRNMAVTDTINEL
jgi:ABC-type antimicrobial peptide transport system permease subunit